MGHAVHPSIDAGRFVCNWTLYLSLMHSQKARQRHGRPLHALFLHVPPVEAVPLETQYRVLQDLLQELAAQLAPAEAAAVAQAGDAGSEQLAAMTIARDGGSAAAAAAQRLPAVQGPGAGAPPGEPVAVAAAASV